MSKLLSETEKTTIIDQNGSRQENILNILLALQEASAGGYVDQETIALVAKKLSTTETKVFEIASFYSMIETKPQAAYVLEVCNSAPCHFTKSDEVSGWLEAELGVKRGEPTSDGLFSFRFTPCVGACDVGPVIKVKDAVYGDLSRDKVKELIQNLKKSK
ncbi:MAG: NAD(P)H-dependent oxidoreductase subunit E [Actinomycetia bacterium]|nr:NAD(P)H-dependent oxidoreductase subunit E [Actinomycetes bacterium]